MSPRHFRIDLDERYVFLAVHLDRYHAAAGCRLHADESYLFLQLLLHLLGLLHHGLHVSGKFHESYLIVLDFSPRGLVRPETFPESPAPPRAPSPARKHRLVAGFSCGLSARAPPRPGGPNNIYFAYTNPRPRPRNLRDILFL